MCEKFVCVFFKKKFCKIRQSHYIFAPYILDTNQQDMEEREK